MACALPNQVPLTLFDLPVLDILVEHIAKFLNWKDLLVFRTCSRKCKELTEKMFGGMRRLEVGLYTKEPDTHTFNCKKGPFPMIFKNCRQLTYIQLNDLTWLTDSLLNKLLVNNPHIKTFKLTHDAWTSGQITNSGLAALASHCKELQNLTLRCAKLTDKFFRSMMHHNCNQLVTVDFSENQKLTGAVLEAFFQMQPHLEDISLNELTTDITRTISVIADTCPKLTDLSITYTPLADANILLKLAEKCPKLTYIGVGKTMYGDPSDPIELKNLKKLLLLKHNIRTKEPCFINCMFNTPGDDECSDEECAKTIAKIRLATNDFDEDESDDDEYV